MCRVVLDIQGKRARRNRGSQPSRRAGCGDRSHDQHSGFKEFSVRSDRLPADRGIIGRGTVRAAQT